MKQEQLMICPNYKMCKKCPNPYHKYPHALIVGGSDACNDIRGGCPACILYEPRHFTEISACEYLKCKYAGRDTEGKPYCRDTSVYRNAAGEAVCGMIDDAIPVEPEYECTTPEDRDFPMYLRKAEIKEAQHD